MTMEKVTKKKLITDLKCWTEKWMIASVDRDPRKQRLETSSSMATIDNLLDKYNEFYKSK